jgi:hypothetical protein
MEISRLTRSPHLLPPVPNRSLWVQVQVSPPLPRTRQLPILPAVQVGWLLLGTRSQSWGLTAVDQILLHNSVELRLIDVRKIIDLNLGEHQHPSPVERLPF